MINKCRMILLAMFFLLSMPSLSAEAATKGTMHLLFVDIENYVSLKHYLAEVKGKFKARDTFVFFDAQTSEVVLEYAHVAGSLRADYRTKLDSIVLAKLDKYVKKKEGGKYNYEKRVAIKQLRGYERDMARMLATAEDYIRIYKDSFAEIRIVFFGDSILHDAYTHRFSEGIPADGFVNSPDSEFNSFPDIKPGNVSVRIFYDEEPEFSKGLLRFYEKLFRKKFGVSLSAYNSNVAMNSVPVSEGPEEFYTDKVRVISENSDSECGTPDKLSPVNYDLETALVNVELVNKCRANSLVTFELVHSNEKKSLPVDANGRVEASFRLSPGINIIRYKSLNGNDWIDVFNEKIEPRPDNIVFNLDESRNTVDIEGKNPFRLDDDHVDIEYEKTGSHYNLDVHDGKFSKEVPVLPGKNVFIVKGLDGDFTTHIIEYSTKCSDVVEPDLVKARENGFLWVNLKNSCREDGSVAKFFYDSQEYRAVMEGGKGLVYIALNHEINDIFYEDYNKNNVKVASIKIRDFSDLIHFAITYKDNVIALSNIYETNIPASDPHEVINYKDETSFRDGHLHVNNPRSKKGEFLVRDPYPDFGDYLSEKITHTYEQFYVSRQSKQGPGDMYFFVDYFSRHGTYTGRKTGAIENPLCGIRSRGGLVIDYTFLFAGTMEKGRKFLDPSKCENGEPTKADNQLILIKKVSIR